MTLEDFRNWYNSSIKKKLFLRLRGKGPSILDVGIFKGGVVKNWSNLLTDSSKKLPTEGGRRGQKSGKFADVLN